MVRAIKMLPLSSRVMRTSLPFGRPTLPIVRLVALPPAPMEEALATDTGASMANTPLCAALRLQRQSVPQVLRVERTRYRVRNLFPHDRCPAPMGESSGEGKWEYSGKEAGLYI